MAQRIDNSVMSKINIPIPEDIKWESVGKGIVDTISGYQAKIDRLERIIFVLYENICMGIKSNILDADDMETSLFGQILEKFNELKK